MVNVLNSCEWRFCEFRSLLMCYVFSSIIFLDVCMSGDWIRSSESMVFYWWFYIARCLSYMFLWIIIIHFHLIVELMGIWLNLLHSCEINIANLLHPCFLLAWWMYFRYYLWYFLWIHGWCLLLSSHIGSRYCLKVRSLGMPIYSFLWMKTANYLPSFFLVIWWLIFCLNSHQVLN